jgi:hypothetical protein
MKSRLNTTEYLDTKYDFSQLLLQFNKYYYV